MPTPPQTADPELTDPRKVRSRNRLLDAATSLLTSGGVEAVTIDAVTRVSKVARTTLYRHFENSTHLLAATFERLVPPVTLPTTTGPLRERLLDTLHTQAQRIDEAPVQLTLWAWVTLGTAKAPRNSLDQNTADKNSGDKDSEALKSLRHRIIEQYRAPFDQLLSAPDAAAELGELDATLALLQLVGPIVLAKITAIKQIDRDDCARIVDDFLAAHTWAHTRAGDLAPRTVPELRR
jgi:AcrR family transcriptional regulator